jgi:hypothetical protein
MAKVLGILCAVAALTATAPVSAQAGDATIRAANAPYEWLIGDWLSDSAGNRLRQSLSWGPQRAYIKYSTYMQSLGKEEHLHFEGIAVWNGKSKVFDYVFAVEPGSGLQEKGTIRVEADGSIVREVEFTDPDGKVGHFRQTFRKTGQDSAVTSLMRETATGWEPNFPGSDKMLMTRTPA